MNKQILRLAIPNIISNITIPLLGMVDLAIMGHLDSVKYIGAISLGGMIFNFIYISFNFLRMGTGGFTAQAFGKNDKKGLLYILVRSVLIAIGFGLLLVLLQVPIEKVAFYFIDGSSDVEGLAAEYFYIRIYAAPATIGLFALTGWYIGMQDAKTPMYVAILINVINLLLNLLFVYGVRMNSNGVALGTLLSQYIGFSYMILHLIKKHKSLFFDLSVKDILDKIALKQFFNVNKDIFVRTIVLVSVFSFFTTESAKLNNKILAVNTLLLQYLMMFSFIMDGFAHAAEALSGKFFGMNNFHLLKKTIKYIFIWGAGLSVIFSLIYFIFSKYSLWLFTDNQNVIDSCSPYLIWITIVPLLAFGSYLWDGIYIGTTASRAMRDTMLLSTFVIFTPAYFLLKPIGNHALWISLLLFLLARGIFQTIFFRIVIFKTYR